MKRIIQAAMMAAATAAAAPMAQAADIPYKVPTVQVFSWTGCYIGGYGGGARSDRTWVTDRGSPSSVAYNDGINHAWTFELDDGATGGGTIGCNWQASAWVAGVEAEGGYLRLRGSAADPLSPARDTVARSWIGDWDAVLALRMGFAFDRVLIYAKGGLAYVRHSTSVIDTCTVAPCGVGVVSAAGDSRNVKWAYGGGLEYAFGYNWTIKGEYLFLGIDHTNLARGIVTAGPSTGTTVGWSERLNGVATAKVGLNYKFDWGGGVQAPY